MERTIMAKDVLKKARHTLGLNQREFSELLGTNPVTLSTWESGKRKPRYPTIRKIVNKLRTKGIKIEYIDLIDEK